jgi:hypothetical protein
MGWTEKEPAGANRPVTSIGRSCGSTSRAASASIRNKQLIAQEIEVATSSHRSREADRVKETANIVVQINASVRELLPPNRGRAIWVGTFDMSGLGEIAKADAVP